MIQLKDFSLSFGHNRVLRNLCLEAKQDERLAVIGSNGSGKTSLAFALAKVIPDFISASVSGKIHCGSPSLLMQSPSTQFFAMTVKEELGGKGRALAKKLGLGHLLGRSVFELSEGEKQKVNLAANLSFAPDALLLDEPLELLDPLEAARFKELIEKLKGKTLLWFDKEDPFLHRERKFFLGKQKAAGLPAKKHRPKKALALEADFSIEKQGFCIGGSIQLRKGEKIALIGRNGSGKTTLLKAIAGIERFSGRIRMKEPVSLAPQNPSHLFFKEQAGLELTEPRNASLLGIEGLLGSSPASLSKGQQKLLSVAAIFGKGIALLDEPTTWLDRKNKARVYGFITGREQPMLIATHDREMLNYCDRVFLIEGGELRECSSTAANRFFLT